MKKKQNRILFLMVAVSLLLCGTVFGGCGEDKTGQTDTFPQTETLLQTETSLQTETPDVTPDNIAGVVSLSADGTDGSCVILSRQEGRYILMTASHVAAKRPEKLLFSGEEVTVKDYYKSPDYDLAFLVIERETTDDLPLANLNETAYDELTEQNSIYAHGIVAGEPVFRVGKLLSDWIYIEDFGYHMLWAEMDNIQGGMSGGGVFDRDGRLLGLLLGTDGKGQIVALPLNIIAGEWKQSDLMGSIDIFSN